MSANVEVSKYLSQLLNLFKLKKSNKMKICVGLSDGGSIDKAYHTAPLPWWFLLDVI